MIFGMESIREEAIMSRNRSCANFAISRFGNNRQLKVGAPRIGSLKMKAKKNVAKLQLNHRKRPYSKPQQVPKLSRLWLMNVKFVREVGKMEQKLWENVWLMRGIFGVVCQQWHVT